MLRLCALLGLAATALALRGDNLESPATEAVSERAECLPVVVPELVHGCFWIPRWGGPCLTHYDSRCDWEEPQECEDIEPPVDPGHCAWVTLHDPQGCVTGFECDCPPDQGPPSPQGDCDWVPVTNSAGCNVAWECQAAGFLLTNFSSLRPQVIGMALIVTEVAAEEPAAFSVLAQDAQPIIDEKESGDKESQLLAIEETVLNSGKRSFLPVLLQRESAEPEPPPEFEHRDAARVGKDIPFLPPPPIQSTLVGGSSAFLPAPGPTFGPLPDPRPPKQLPQLPPLIPPTRRRSHPPPLPLPPPNLGRALSPPLSFSAHLPVLPRVPLSRSRTIPLQAAPVHVPQPLPLPPRPVRFSGDATSSITLEANLAAATAFNLGAIPPLPAAGPAVPLAPFGGFRGPIPSRLPLDIPPVPRPFAGPLRPVGLHAGPFRPHLRPHRRPVAAFAPPPFRCFEPPPVPTQKDKSLVCTPIRNRAGCIYDFDCSKKIVAPVVCPSAPEKPRRSQNCNWVAILDRNNCIVDYECEPKEPETCENEPIRPDDTPFCKFIPIKSHIGCNLKWECEPNLPGLLLARRRLALFNRGPAVLPIARPAVLPIARPVVRQLGPVLPARVLPLGGLPSAVRLGTAPVVSGAPSLTALQALQRALLG